MKILLSTQVPAIPQIILDALLDFLTPFAVAIASR